MKKTAFIVSIACMLCFFGCNSSDYYNETDVSDSQSITSASEKLEETEQEVIRRFKKYSDIDTFIEDSYIKYPDSDIIANIYFYANGKSFYQSYEDLKEVKYFIQAGEFACMINPDYSGEFSEEMQSFANKLVAAEDRGRAYKTYIRREKNYRGLSNYDKKEICDYIQSLYDEGKDSETIWHDVMKKYDLPYYCISIIWFNMYSY